MAYPREYLRELLKKAIPDSSGETVNFCELRNFLEASIEHQTRSKSSTSSKENDNRTQHLPAEYEHPPFVRKEDEKQNLSSDEDKDVISVDEVANEASSLKSETESIDDTDERKHIVSSTRSKTAETHVETTKRDPNRRSTVKHEKNSSSQVNRPSVRSKSRKSHRNSHAGSKKADAVRSSKP